VLQGLVRVRAADTVAQLLAAAQSNCSSSSSSSVIMEQLRCIVFERFELRYRWNVEREKRAAAEQQQQQQQQRIIELEEELRCARASAKGSDISLQQLQELSAAAAASNTISLQKVSIVALLIRLRYGDFLFCFDFSYF
jgi:hypothetical protein